MLNTPEAVGFVFVYVLLCALLDARQLLVYRLSIT